MLRKLLILVILFPLLGHALEVDVKDLMAKLENQTSTQVGVAMPGFEPGYADLQSF